MCRRGEAKEVRMWWEIGVGSDGSDGAVCQGEEDDGQCGKKEVSKAGVEKIS